MVTPAGLSSDLAQWRELVLLLPGLSCSVDKGRAQALLWPHPPALDERLGCWCGTGWNWGVLAQLGHFLG